MPILRCYVDDRTMAILQRVADAKGRTVEDLAEAAIESAAIAELPRGFAGGQQHFALDQRRAEEAEKLSPARPARGRCSMMIPPTIRIGPPPPLDRLRPKLGLVVLTRRGWLMTKWHPHGHVLLDEDAIAINTRYINPNDVICWMPEDGS